MFRKLGGSEGAWTGRDCIETLKFIFRRDRLNDPEGCLTSAMSAA